MCVGVSLSFLGKQFEKGCLAIFNNVLFWDYIKKKSTWTKFEQLFEKLLQQ